MQSRQKVELVQFTQLLMKEEHDRQAPVVTLGRKVSWQAVQLICEEEVL